MIVHSIFNFYAEAKKKHPDIDDWLTESLELEYPGMSDTLQAISLCTTSNEPWECAEVFEKVCLILNNRIVIGDMQQELSIKEINLAVTLLKHYFPDEYFSDDICRYIAAIAENEGFIIMPSVLHFVQRFLPIVKLTPDQEAVQAAYLSECNEYFSIVSSL